MTSAVESSSLINKAGIGTPLLLVMLIAMMVLPLPPFMLDILFTFNITLALIVLLCSVYANSPLSFASFPTVLLIATLLRLGLNVASTRIVLLEGHTGTDAVGAVVESFGNVVIGGNYAVGLVVFLILVVINFVVVTKGAGRVSEVSARFTLDAMPGKQMAIDADLNAGIIDQEEAKSRREKIAEESDFYGSMDGASKFVRGDAIAGILILIINLIGGVSIGIAQFDLSFQEAVQNYALLTIGDGLVAQIPSLLLSSAAAIMVTRVSKTHDMGDQVFQELFSNPRVLGISGSIMLILGLIPGMPHFVFLGLGALVSGLSFVSLQQKRKRAAIKEEEEAQAQPVQDEESRELGWEDVAQVDTIGLEVGYRLISLVDKNQGGQLLARIKGIRKKISQELGFLIPTVHIRDNLDLSPNVYRISLMGVSVGEAEVIVDRFLAINPGKVFGELEGVPGKDPAFGLDAIWITEDQREYAQTLGYTVVDAGTAIATHLSQILKSHASELLGHEEVQKLLERLSQKAPKLVEGLVPDKLPLGTVVKVLQGLLNESVPIRDMRTIIEAMSDCALVRQDHDGLLSAVRIALKRMIVQEINGTEPQLPVMTLDPQLEQILQSSVEPSGNGGISIEPGMAEMLQKSLLDSVQKFELTGQPAVLLVAGMLRGLLVRFAKLSVPDLHVLSYEEVPDNKQVKIVQTIGATPAGA